MNFGPLEFAAFLRRKGEREPATVRAARAAVAVPAPQENRMKVVSGGFEPARAAAPDAPLVKVVEAIATRTAAGRRPRRPLRVVLREPGPVVVVLSAHEPVHWRLVIARGVTVCAILLAGCGESSVAGAGDAVVKTIGGFYAFKRELENFRHLELEVLRTTGSFIGGFRSLSGTRIFEFDHD